MSANSGVKAGEAWVALLTDNSQLINGLKAASKHVEEFAKKASQTLSTVGKGLRSFGKYFFGAGMTALGAGFKSALDFAKTGDDLSKMSKRLGTSTEFLSEMGYAAKQSGTDLSQLEKALYTMSKQMGKTGEGGVEDRFDRVARQISSVKNPSVQAAMAVKEFGKAGMALLPMLQEGSKGMEALRAEARELGISMSGEDADAAVTLSTAWTRLTETFKSAKNMIGAALAPVLTGLMKGITPIIASIGKWIKDNKQVIVTIFGIAFKVAAFGAVLIGAGTAVIFLSSVIGGLGTFLGIATVAFTGVMSVLGFILSPIGLVVAAIVGLGYYFLKSSGMAGKAVGWLKKQFASLFEFASETFQGICDAVMAGDLSLAFEVAMSAVRLVWLKATNWILDKWYLLKFGIQEAWANATYWLADKFVEVTAGFQKAMIAIQKAWVTLVGTLKSAWSSYQLWWQKKMNSMIGKAMGADQAYIDSMNKADDAYFTAQSQAAQSEMQTQIAALDNQAKEIDEKKEGTLAILKADKERGQTERATAHAAALTEMEAAEADARGRWKAATKLAAAKRADKEAEKEKEKDARRIFENIPVVATSGTFSAFEIGSLGQTDVQQKQLDALEDIKGLLEEWGVVK